MKSCNDLFLYSMKMRSVIEQSSFQLARFTPAFIPRYEIDNV